MPYDSVISRSDAGALIPEEASRDILKLVPKESAALTRFRRLQMSRKQFRMPILSALPTAYFVDGDTGLKQTTEAAWSNKYLTAEEIACICPIPEAVLDDTDFDVWGEVTPLIAEAVGRTFDAAVFFNTNKPSSWPTAIGAGAAAASNTETRNSAASAGGAAQDISDTFALVEADGYDVNGIVAARKMRGITRSARNADGDVLPEITSDSWYGVSVDYPMRGLWPTGSGSIEAIVGDFTQGIVGLRQDLTYKLLTEASIHDDEGALLYNLAQQDMVALRVVFRAGFQIANVINHDNSNDATRYPFATLLQS